MKKIYMCEKVDMKCKLAEKVIPQSVYETYCSFANSKGGDIVLGVEEDKSKSGPSEKISGIHELGAVEFSFSKATGDPRIYGKK
ncbi:MAG: ATP-binding protein [Lachnospiraceae bacterium]|nr:ATP-binding protein [Lachnospiraceae bacterium]